MTVFAIIQFSLFKLKTTKTVPYVETDYKIIHFLCDMLFNYERYVIKVKVKSITNTSNSLRHGSHSVTCNNIISAFTGKHSPGGVTTHMHSKCMSSTYYSFIDPMRMNG